MEIDVSAQHLFSIDLQASAEKNYKHLVEQLNSISKKVEESNLHLGDFDNQKRRMTMENADLLKQLQEISSTASLMVKQKAALMAALDEQRGLAENEAKERLSLLSKFKNLEHSADGLRENYDEEVNKQICCFCSLLTHHDAGGCQGKPGQTTDQGPRRR